MCLLSLSRSGSATDRPTFSLAHSLTSPFSPPYKSVKGQLCSTELRLCGGGGDAELLGGGVVRKLFRGRPCLESDLSFPSSAFTSSPSLRWVSIFSFSKNFDLLPLFVAPARSDADKL